MRNSFNLKILIGLLLTVIYSTAGYSQTNGPAQPTSLTQHSSQPETRLDDLVLEALANNQDLQAAYFELKAAQLRISQASSLPNPTAGYAYMGRDLETPLGPQEEIYEFEQMIPFPGKLIEQRQVAKADLAMSEAAVNAKKQELVLKVTQTYYDLYSLQESLMVLEEIKNLLEKMESVAQSRYASSSGSQKDVTQAQMEISQTTQQILDLRQQQTSLSAFLFSLLNKPTPEQLFKISAPVLKKEIKTLVELNSILLQKRPEFLQSKAYVDRQKHARTLARYENAPDFFVGFQYSKIGNGTTIDPNDGRDAWMIPFKVTLPIWQGRIQSAISEANQNLKSAQARFQNEQRQSEYELQSAYSRYTTQRNILELYELSLIPQAELAFRSDQSGYEAGRGDLFNLLNSERALLNAKMTYYQIYAETLKSYAAIERVIGVSLREGELK